MDKQIYRRVDKQTHVFIIIELPKVVLSTKQIAMMGVKRTRPAPLLLLRK